jgi:uncharacterized membrane protein SirB2
MGVASHARHAGRCVYPLIKYIHMTAAGLSLGGFLLRVWWRRHAPERLADPLTRTLPHINDTVLLGAGVTLAVHTGWSPLTHAWLAVKIVALVLYILLGAMALRGPTAGVRRGAFVAAVIVFLYIVSVAVTKQPWWWLNTL